MLAAGTYTTLIFQIGGPSEQAFCWSANFIAVYLLPPGP